MIPGGRWLTELTPGPLSTLLRLPAAGTVEHLRLRWTGADTSGVTVRQPVVTAVPPFDLVLSEATAANGATVARLEITVRHLDIHPDAPCGVPEHPTMPMGDRAWSFIVRPEEVVQHLAEVHSALDDAPACATRDGGMPLPVVPTTLLAQIAARSALRGPVGDVEAWFLAPVPVAALVNVHEQRSNGLAQLVLAGRDTPAVIVRASPMPSGVIASVA